MLSHIKITCSVNFDGRDIGGAAAIIIPTALVVSLADEIMAEVRGGQIEVEGNDFTWELVGEP